MYLHIGNNKNIRERNIIGIFDADTATVSTITRRFLTGAEKQKRVESATDELPKSFILYEENKEYRICFSQLSSSALLGRSINNIETERS